ncbi:hypothetical protein SODALDRAFT_354949 [Sodiomyces alkalinus F11]|uniref:Uncharacterized protein n=1 Tax=Sodiomyces alkalinus (strain CBS 110278 / VKM F-3762 / F11) TaxID=1314773 RepID=A0A3N2Q7M0_SODAK|nr:hypothetical protein SODALDRAFT_354949 [Sodiomyces alkalinus F11]ROT42764.1 hypothetical protein SODALDRAFT_354949 [Sodiomyces alkalinus F11]
MVFDVRNTYVTKAEKDAIAFLFETHRSGTKTTHPGPAWPSQHQNHEWSARILAYVIHRRTTHRQALRDPTPRHLLKSSRLSALAGSLLSSRTLQLDGIGSSEAQGCLLWAWDQICRTTICIFYWHSAALDWNDGAGHGTSPEVSLSAHVRTFKVHGSSSYTCSTDMGRISSLKSQTSMKHDEVHTNKPISH